MNTTFVGLDKQSEMTDVLAYELTAIPPSLFDEKTGAMCQP